jgi:hypothetical protein
VATLQTNSGVECRDGLQRKSMTVFLFPFFLFSIETKKTGVLFSALQTGHCTPLYLQDDKHYHW